VNTPLRRVGLAMLGMIILLLANVTYIQIFKADDYRKNINNKRIALEEYSRERGKILVRSGDNPEILATVQAPRSPASTRPATARAGWRRPRTRSSTAPTTGCSCAGCRT